MRTAVGKCGWSKALAEKEQTIDDLMENTGVKNVYGDLGQIFASSPSRGWRPR